MFGQNFSAVDISATGLNAERFRMEVIANNIANARSTRTAEGGPYRRQLVIFASQLDNQSGSLAGSAGQMKGVRVLGVDPDPGEHPQVYEPGHPDADENGMLRLPNVKIANEMVDLISASRAYEANLRSIRTFKRMAEQSLMLLRGNG